MKGKKKSTSAQVGYIQIISGGPGVIFEIWLYKDVAYEERKLLSKVWASIPLPPFYIASKTFFFLWMALFEGTVPTYKTLFEDTVSRYKTLFEGIIPTVTGKFKLIGRN